MVVQSNRARSPWSRRNHIADPANDLVEGVIRIVPPGYWA
jgi:hypothetical protein